MSFLPNIEDHYISTRYLPKTRYAYRHPFSVIKFVNEPKLQPRSLWLKKKLKRFHGLPVYRPMILLILSQLPKLCPEIHTLLQPKRRLIALVPFMARLVLLAFFTLSILIRFAGTVLLPICMVVVIRH